MPGFVAEIITIGDELLSGETVDTNSNHLDRVMEAHGYTVARHTTVADDVEAIADAFRGACARADVVVSSGGLGPTLDDLTLEGLAKALGCGLRKDEGTLAEIRARFERIGRPMTPNNERQAMVPEVGEVLKNEVGTAPAFTAPLGRAKVFLLPGVPHEMRWLTEQHVLPRIEKGTSPVLRRTIKVIGIGESMLEHQIKEVVRAHRDVRFGYRTLGVENHIKLAAEGEGREAAVARAEEALRAVLGDQAYGVDAEDLSSIVGGLLAARKETVALAESCTGGLATKLLTDVSGASAYVLGGVFAYANAVKVALCGVAESTIAAHGAVSKPVAAEMAEGVRARLGASWGLSATGIAGPSGGSAEKPVGTVHLGIAGAEGTETREVRLPGDRDRIRIGSATLLLELLRRRLVRASSA